ncbi:MAG: hypothetical protein RMH75_01675 [Archaeoglobaceae archaeon]|nr:hypothetical protein [Archaeoglobaceae archaeon]MDW7989368.1 hypothetical protein [Archaeoglobaceae archaeon]
MRKLILLGKPKKVSKSGLLLVSISPTNLPRIGERVVTRKLEEVGTVVDIIGPIVSPYALVKPSKVVDEDLFVVKEHGGDRKSKRKGGRERSRKERS